MALPDGQSRNAPCPCGSGKKYKHCHGALGALGAQGEPAPAPVDRSLSEAAQNLFRRAIQLLQAGQPMAAAPLLSEAIRLNPQYFDAHHALGSVLIGTGRFPEASAMLLRALALKPDSAAAWRDLGIACDRQNQHEPAIEAFQRAVTLNSKQGDALHRLGELYVMYSRMTDAADCFERAAKIDPDTTKARIFRSDAAMLRGDITGAEQWARKAVALDRTSLPANGTLAGLLYTQGRFDDATNAYEAALKLNGSAARCWYGLAHCRKFQPGDTALLDRMRPVAARTDLNDNDRTFLHFAMAKVCDDLGEYSEAMEHFDAANRLRAKELRFDRARIEALVDRNIRVFTREFFAAQAGLANPSSKPMFIVGMYRSGTTLVEQILSSHPQVAAGDELTVWMPTDLEVDSVTGAFDAERTEAAIARYLSVLQSIGPEAARVTDKLPLNLFRLGAIHALLPNARIVHCRRDPIDTCLSIYTNLFKSRVNFAARKEDLAFFYRQYLRMMDHWRAVLPAEKFIEVEYEQLTAAPEAETRRLIAFAGLDWDEKCLKPEENRRAVSTASAWQVRQPIYKTSSQRWRRYEPWLGELRTLLADEPPHTA